VRPYPGRSAAPDLRFRPPTSGAAGLDASRIEKIADHDSAIKRGAAAPMGAPAALNAELRPSIQIVVACRTG